MHSLIQDMTKISCSQGFGLLSTNCEELLLMRVLVQGHVELVQALVALVQAHVDLVLAQPPQGGLIWMVRRQIVEVVGSGSGLVGAVWLVFVSGVRGKKVCYLQVVNGLGVGLDEPVVLGPKG